MAAGRDEWRDAAHLWDRLASWLTASERDGEGALTALGDVARLRRVLEHAELVAVRSARRDNKSWTEIATMLGMTRQSAWERWRDLDPDAPSAALTAAVREEVDAAVRRRGASELAGRVGDRVRRRHKLVAVPRVVGLTVGGAQMVLREYALMPRWADNDQARRAEAVGPEACVSGQAPEQGARVGRGTSVRLWVAADGGGSGVREPRHPKPQPKQGRELNYESVDEA